MPSEERGRPAVVSQFFAKSSSSTQPKAAAASSNGLKKQTSIISLSSSDGIDEDDDDIIEVIEAAPASSYAAKKRKASLIDTVDPAKKSSKSTVPQEAPSKKVKVAPLFERVKNAGSTSSFSVKKEEDSGTVQRLQQWKFAAGSHGESHQSTPPPGDSTVRNAANGSPDSSSPLPELDKSTQAVQARRAHVRKMLLGIDTEWRKPRDDEAEVQTVPAEDAEGADDDKMTGDEPVASTSKLPANGKAKKGKNSGNSSASTPDLSKFAAPSEKGKKGKSSSIADKKGKGKAVEPTVKYTPLEQQVVDIKKKYVGRVTFASRGRNCLTVHRSARHPPYR